MLKSREKSNVSRNHVTAFQHKIKVISYLAFSFCIFGGKTENRGEKVGNNNNVSLFPSILGQSITYHVLFDVMSPLLACYAQGAHTGLKSP